MGMQMHTLLTQFRPPWQIVNTYLWIIIRFLLDFLKFCGPMSWQQGGGRNWVSRVCICIPMFWGFYIIKIGIFTIFYKKKFFLLFSTAYPSKIRFRPPCRPLCSAGAKCYISSQRPRVMCTVGRGAEGARSPHNRDTHIWIYVHK